MKTYNFILFNIWGVSLGGAQAGNRHASKAVPRDVLQMLDPALSGERFEGPRCSYTTQFVVPSVSTGQPYRLPCKH
jgi:hypothetical protein